MRKYTVIEFIILIVIIAIVAAIVIPAVMKGSHSASGTPVLEQKAVNKMEVIFELSHSSSEYYTAVYKFNYEGEAYLVSNNGGIVRVEKHQTGEDK